MNQRDEQSGDRQQSGDRRQSQGRELARAALRAARNAARKTSTARTRRTRTSGDPILLGESVEGLVAERGWVSDVAIHEVLGRWDQIVGADIAAQVQPHSFTHGILHLTASSTAWATQVRLLAPEFLKRLAAEVGEGVVTRIEVRGPSAPSWRKGPRSVPGRGPRDTYG